jgi:lysozyme
VRYVGAEGVDNKVPGDVPEGMYLDESGNLAELKNKDVRKFRKEYPWTKGMSDETIRTALAMGADPTGVHPVEGFTDEQNKQLSEYLAKNPSKNITEVGITELDQKIMKSEGYRDQVYKDTEGYDTIGYGHKLTKDEIASGKYADGITQEEAMKLYKEDRVRTSEGFYSKAPWAKQQPEPVKEVLEDMAFNMGPDGLLGFKDTLKYIKAGDYRQAAENIKKSKYYTQVPNRAQANIDKLLALANG